VSLFQDSYPILPNQIFEKYGKIGKVTIVKDRVTRESKGVAFVLFVERASAYRAIQALNRKELFGRTLKVCIAADNGRAKDFIKRKVYKDKSRCYECGEGGHLSYRCPKNQLGDREKPEKKLKKKKKADSGTKGVAKGLVEEEEVMSEEEEEEVEEEEEFGLGDAIR
jgi:U11/U12 small nuclear ribonucleoprotein SNRNP31